MKFCWTTLHVKNLDASIKFYTELVGLSLNRRFKPNDHMELAFLGSEPTELELIEDTQAPKQPVDGISIGFLVDGKLEPLMTTLKEHGFTQLSEIFTPNPVMRFFYVKDPDGFSVQFVEDSR